MICLQKKIPAGVWFQQFLKKLSQIVWLIPSFQEFTYSFWNKKSIVGKIISNKREQYTKYLLDDAFIRTRQPQWI